MTEARERRSIAAMGTIVTIDVPAARLAEGPAGRRRHGPAAGRCGEAGAGRQVDSEAAVERALEWFRQVEACCTRFDLESELMRLSRRPGAPVRVSTMLFEAVQFALAVAVATGGAFDPAVGLAMEALGFNRDYRSGAAVERGKRAAGVERGERAAGNDSGREDDAARATYRDVRLDAASRSITLLRPLVLDLGAVAKGLAMDMAARELEPLGSFVIDAGGDLYLGGGRPEGEAWSVGIRHPRVDDGLIEALRVRDRAVCTSGDYERRTPGGEGHHILDPRTGQCADRAVSATVVVPSAMLADALATAAFVLGPEEGVALLERMGVEGLVVAPSLETRATQGLARLALAAAHPAAAAGVSSSAKAAGSGAEMSELKLRTPEGPTRGARL